MGRVAITAIWTRSKQGQGCGNWDEMECCSGGAGWRDAELDGDAKTGDFADTIGLGGCKW